MKAGGAFWPLVRVLDPSTGNPVIGLSSTSWTVTCYLNGTVTAVTTAWTEVGNGYYKVNVTLPASAGYVVILISNGSYLLTPNRWEGANTIRDVDDVYTLNNASRSYQSSVTGSPYTDTPLTLDANRAQTVVVQVNNAAGAPVDLSGYNNWRMTVWDKTHSNVSTRTIINTGITGSAGGVLSVTIPETAGFFSLIDAAISASNDTLTLYYDVVADAAATATLSQNIIRGTINLRRYEGAA